MVAVITVPRSLFSMVGLQSLLNTVHAIKKNMHLKMELPGIAHPGGPTNEGSLRDTSIS